MPLKSSGYDLVSRREFAKEDIHRPMRDLSKKGKKHLKNLGLRQGF